MSVVSHTAVSAHVALGSCAQGSAAQRRVRGFASPHARGAARRTETRPKREQLLYKPEPAPGQLQYLPRKNPRLSRGHGSAALKRREGPKYREKLVCSARRAAAGSQCTGERAPGGTSRKTHTMKLRAWGRSSGATSW